MSNNMTGKPSIDRPWMKYYPEVLQKMVQIPECTVKEYLKKYCPYRKRVSEEVLPGRRRCSYGVLRQPDCLENSF